ncbi:MAG: hypothetical protein JW810_02655 [Sedimentisphaerales bacterium]|nr:hypothetical protein [Sedimentisphaerales bacterium]
MKKRARLFLSLVLVLFWCQTAGATLVDLGVATDQQTYLPGEAVVVWVSASNPTAEYVNLTFTSTLQASYCMDGEFYWHENQDSFPVITYVTLDPYETYSWELVHSTAEMQDYPLGIGTHTVAGMVMAFELGGQGSTDALSFEVIPEPASVLFVLGGLAGLARRSRRR